MADNKRKAEDTTVDMDSRPIKVAKVSNDIESLTTIAQLAAPEYDEDEFFLAELEDMDKMMRESQKEVDKPMRESHEDVRKMDKVLRDSQGETLYHANQLLEHNESGLAQGPGQGETSNQGIEEASTQPTETGVTVNGKRHDEVKGFKEERANAEHDAFSASRTKFFSAIKDILTQPSVPQDLGLDQRTKLISQVVTVEDVQYRVTVKVVKPYNAETTSNHLAKPVQQFDPENAKLEAEHAQSSTLSSSTNNDTEKDATPLKGGRFCTFANSAIGCKNGENCRYDHRHVGTICRYVKAGETCPHGSRCYYLHKIAQSSHGAAIKPRVDAQENAFSGEAHDTKENVIATEKVSHSVLSSQNKQAYQFTSKNGNDNNHQSDSITHDGNAEGTVPRTIESQNQAFRTSNENKEGNNNNDEVVESGGRGGRGNKRGRGRGRGKNTRGRQPKNAS